MTISIWSVLYSLIPVKTMIWPFLAFLIRGSTLLITLTVEKKVVSNCSRTRDLVRVVCESSSIVPTSATTFRLLGRSDDIKTTYLHFGTLREYQFVQIVLPLRQWQIGPGSGDFLVAGSVRATPYKPRDNHRPVSPCIQRNHFKLLSL
jgi:hypothetical protein